MRHLARGDQVQAAHAEKRGRIEGAAQVPPAVGDDVPAAQVAERLAAGAEGIPEQPERPDDQGWLPPDQVAPPDQRQEDNGRDTRAGRHQDVHV